MLISCLYASTACNASDFEWYYDTLYGNCYMFNKGSNSSIKMSTNTGKWNGLRLELYVGSINELEVNQQSSGAHIFIQNHIYNYDLIREQKRNINEAIIAHAYNPRNIFNGRLVSHGFEEFEECERSGFSS